MDWNLLPLYTYQPRSSTAPLWSIIDVQQFCDFEVTTKDATDREDEITENADTYTCHICDVNVPKVYIWEHNQSDKHRTHAAILDLSLDRMRRHMSLSAYTTAHHGRTFYCPHCCCAVAEANKTAHETSELHKHSLLHDTMIKSLKLIYENKNNVSKVLDDIVELLKSTEKDFGEPSKNNKAFDNPDVSAKATESGNKELENVNYFNTTEDENKKIDSNEPSKTDLDQFFKIIMLPNFTQSFKSADKEFIQVQTSSGDVKLAVKDYRNCKAVVEAGLDMIHIHMQEKDEVTYCNVCKTYIANEKTAIIDHVKTEEHKKKYSVMLKDNSMTNLNDIVTYCTACSAYVLEWHEMGHIGDEKHKRNIRDKSVTNKDHNDSSTESAGISQESTDSKPENPTTGNSKPVDKHVLLKNDVIEYNSDLLFCNVCRVFVKKSLLLYHVNKYDHRTNLSKRVDKAKSTVNAPSVKANRPKPATEFYNLPNELEKTDKEVKCTVCNVVIPNTVPNINGHLLGQRHLNAVDAKAEEEKAKNIAINEKINKHDAGVSDGNQNVVATQSYADMARLDNDKTVKGVAGTSKETAKNTLKASEVTKGKLVPVTTLNKLPSEIEVTDKGVKCKICNVAVPYNVSNINDHLLGQRHAKEVIAKAERKAKIIVINEKINKQGVSNCDNQNVAAKTQTKVTKVKLLPVTTLNKLPSCIEKMVKEVKCNICNVVVPNTVSDINDHLLGQRHTDEVNANAEIKAKIIAINENINRHGAGVSHGDNQNFAAKTQTKVTKEKLVPVTTLKKLPSCIDKMVKEVTCNICKVVVPNTVSNINDHLLGQRHADEVNAKAEKKAKLIAINEKINKHGTVSDGNNQNVAATHTFADMGHLNNDQTVKEISGTSKETAKNIQKAAEVTKVKLHYLFEITDDPNKVRCKVCSVEFDMVEALAPGVLDKHRSSDVHKEAYSAKLEAQTMCRIQHTTYCLCCDKIFAIYYEYYHMNSSLHKLNLATCTERLDKASLNRVAMLKITDNLAHDENNIPTIENITADNTGNRKRTKFPDEAINVQKTREDVHEPPKESETVKLESEHKNDDLNSERNDEDDSSDNHEIFPDIETSNLSETQSYDTGINEVLPEDTDDNCDDKHDANENDEIIIDIKTDAVEMESAKLQVEIDTKAIDEQDTDDSDTDAEYIFLQDVYVEKMETGNKTKDNCNYIVCEACEIDLMEENLKYHYAGTYHKTNEKLLQETKLKATIEQIVANQPEPTDVSTKSGGILVEGFCTICNVEVQTDSINAVIHTDGKKHQKNLKTIYGETQTPSTSAANVWNMNKKAVFRKQPRNSMEKKYACNICNKAVFNAANQLLDHMNAFKHNKKVRRLAAKVGKLVDDTYFTSGVCKTIENTVSSDNDTELASTSQAVAIDTYFTQAISKTTENIVPSENDTELATTSQEAAIEHPMAETHQDEPHTTQTREFYWCNLCKKNVPNNDFCFHIHTFSRKGSNETIGTKDENEKFHKDTNNTLMPNLLTSYMDIDQSDDFKDNIDNLKDKPEVNDPNATVPDIIYTKYENIVMPNWAVETEDANAQSSDDAERNSENVINDTQNDTSNRNLDNETTAENENPNGEEITVGNNIINDAQIDGDNHTSDSETENSDDENDSGFFLCKTCQLVVPNDPVEIKCHLHSYRHQTALKENEELKLNTDEKFDCDICGVEIRKNAIAIKTHLETDAHNNKLQKVLLKNCIQMRDGRVCYCEACDLYFTKNTVPTHIAAKSHIISLLQYQRK